MIGPWEGLELPPGYRLRLDPDLLSLCRPGGSEVAAFSARGVLAERMEAATGGEGSLPRLRSARSLRAVRHIRPVFMKKSGQCPAAAGLGRVGSRVSHLGPARFLCANVLECPSSRHSGEQGQKKAVGIQASHSAGPGRQTRPVSSFRVCTAAGVL
jgi:hypothetical protein